MSNPDGLDLQRLALAEAVVKSCKDVTSTKGGPHGAPNLRTEADDALRSAFEASGVDRMRIMVNGREVGTLSARVSKPVEGTEVMVGDVEAFVRWLRESDGGLDALRRVVYADYGACRKLVEAATADGELPDGCRVVERREPARWLGTALKVSPQEVATALAGELPQAIAGLISGEVE